MLLSDEDDQRMEVDKVGSEDVKQKDKAFYAEKREDAVDLSLKEFTDEVV